MNCSSLLASLTTSAVFQGWRPFRIPDYLTSFMSCHKLTPDPDSHWWNPQLIHLTDLLSPQFYTQPAFASLPKYFFLQVNVSGVSRCFWPSCAMDNVPSCPFDQLHFAKFVGTQGSPQEEMGTLLSWALLSRKWGDFALVMAIYLCFNQVTHR